MYTTTTDFKDINGYRPALTQDHANLRDVYSGRKRPDETSGGIYFNAILAIFPFGFSLSDAL